MSKQQYTIRNYSSAARESSSFAFHVRSFIFFICNLCEKSFCSFAISCFFKGESSRVVFKSILGSFRFSKRILHLKIARRELRDWQRARSAQLGRNREKTWSQVRTWRSSAANWLSRRCWDSRHSRVSLASRDFKHCSWARSQSPMAVAQNLKRAECQAHARTYIHIHIARVRAYEKTRVLLQSSSIARSVIIRDRVRKFRHVVKRVIYSRAIVPDN